MAPPMRKTENRGAAPIVVPAAWRVLSCVPVLPSALALDKNGKGRLREKRKQYRNVQEAHSTCEGRARGAKAGGGARGLAATVKKGGRSPPLYRESR